MKITGVKVRKHYAKFKARYESEERSVGPLDIHQDYNTNVRAKGDTYGGQAKPDSISSYFIYITTDEGLEGVHGPLDTESQILEAAKCIAPHIIGRDPMENRLIWDVMSRYDRHATAGVMLMAISALDNALWDLKGKILNLPVYKLLGGWRGKIRPYISTLGLSVEPEKAVKRALEIRDMGINAQKWFFRHGPSDGVAGMEKNLKMAFALREALGPHYELGFDCWMGWTIDYAKSMFRELEQVNPMWVEEVLRPHMLDGYEKLRAETSIRLSAGEHLYTRMQVNTYLQKGIFDVIQSDPEWCGGITESMKIADLCEIYGVKFIPHGHAFLPAMHIVAAMPPDVCPYGECLITLLDKKTHFYKYELLDGDGFLHLSEEPGLGGDPDEAKIIKTEEVAGFMF